MHYCDYHIEERETVGACGAYGGEVYGRVIYGKAATCKTKAFVRE
jgi:hypothetical protein